MTSDQQGGWRDAGLARAAVGQRVRLNPLRVADEPKGEPHWLPAFAPVGDGALA